MVKIYAVIDTNVLVSALLSRFNSTSTVQLLQLVILGDITPIYNDEILDEYLVTGNLKHFPKKPFVVTPAEMLQIIHEMKSPKPGLLSEPIVRYGKR